MRHFCLVSTEVWLSPNGGRRVGCAYWRGKCWVLHCSWLKSNFNSDYRLVIELKARRAPSGEIRGDKEMESRCVS